MDSKLLDYYNRELAYLREMGAEFAQRYPKVAGRLGMRGIEVADPYTERLMEGFAFLTSRVQLKMDAEFPRFSQRLLEMIAPNYLAPTPSMAIAELHPDSSKGDIRNGFNVPRGTMMDSQTLKKSGVTCSYTTAQDVMLQPIRIKQVELGGVPADAPLNQLGLSQRGAASALRIRIECDDAVLLNHLSFDNLTFFLSGPDIQATKLLELIMAHGVGQFCQTVEKQPQRLTLADDALRHEGFAADQALLPEDMRNFDGYRLLHEYFAFPQRFQFFSLQGLRPLLSRSTTAREFEIVVLLDKSEPALERVVDVSHLALHCTPVINLFPRVAQRQKLNEGQFEYHLVVDNIRPLDYEVFSVSKLYASGGKQEQIFRPFWSTYGSDDGNYGAYFSLRREQRALSEQAQRYGTRTGYVGSEVFLTMVDEKQSPWNDELTHFTADVLCTSRDLPLMLIQQGQANFVMPDSIPVKQLTLRKGPTPPRPSLAEGLNTWRLVSHLQMNYLSLMEQDQGKGSGALRQMLGLYANLAEAPIARQIEGIRDCQLRAVNRRVPEPGPIVFARGVGIELKVDEQAFSGSSPWLMGSVLERVFSRLVSMNSFTEMSLSSQQRGDIGWWAPRMGKRTLL
ncbi:MAG: type VI secretion system baseplate subunit TssF [Ewingella americana]|jgi:type VI secretion system protein ImpG|uniref:type VI secretion system baseplate subunit TssF n=1 Tax=Ewingella americana TaxID=41202 RepID=UPI0024332CA4|nr:type VI secretion system baseplate subunit TssF [Ewingella americana]MCI1680121.1 type VI secretion system baseplate subunit TssF [Ewingella americana]MCI1855116.1 type VI secretion system baseplate subunit TssF [Ewingella americana]MCI1863593.1 type VI secretion system baseplate subunit TssF [Ewingella americana]MCI2144269.1 type VI secretion system baseplate subunit TssF [Ewingella americana]MCI2163820.1 type VI secretion system baseplate subunit TssF [Ewingella americana]